MTEEHLTGQEKAELLPGVGRLGRQLEITAESTLYQAELEGAAGPVVVEIRPGGTAEAAEQLTRWRDCLELAHPHLLKVYRAGESVWDGEPVIFSVSERADESLAGVLEERPLSEEETREMLGPVLAALAYLHQSGYVHCGLRPSEVRAVGETLKLSCGSVRRNSSSAHAGDDMFSVGVLVVQAVTRELPTIEEESGPYILREVSEPLTGIVRHCLESEPARRWTAAEALAHLSPVPLAAAPVPLAAAPVPLAAAPVPLAAAPVRQEVEAPVESPPVAALPERPAAAESSATAFPRKWIYAAVGALLLIFAAWAFTGKKDSARPAVAAPVAGAAAASSSAAAASSVPPSALRRSEPAAKPAGANAIPPPAAKSQNRKASGWATIVASYGPKAAAEKRAVALSKRWPKFRCEVYRPSSQGLHFVVIGKNLSEEKAEALRDQARQAGLGKNVYIQRFE